MHTAPRAAPQALSLTALTSTSLNVSWEAPPSQDQQGIITNYTVYYQTEQDMSLSQSITVSVLYVELTELEKFTVYNVSVSASTIVGGGPVANDTVRTLSDSECMFCV